MIVNFVFIFDLGVLIGIIIDMNGNIVSGIIINVWINVGGVVIGNVVSD